MRHTTQRRSIIRWSVFAAGAMMATALTFPAPAEAAFDRDDRPDDLLVGIVRLSSS